MDQWLRLTTGTKEQKMIDPVTRDLARYEIDTDQEDFISEELGSLIDSPEGEGLTRQVEFWVVGADEEPESNEIISRLAGLSMLEESFYSDAYKLCAGER